VKVAIVGSRTFFDRQLVERVVKRLVERDPSVVIVSGGAQGADTLAERAARRLCSTAPIVFPAEWHLHGRSAGFIRNQAIVNESDELVALWDGVSAGTMHSISLARRKPIPTYVYLEPRRLWLDGDAVDELIH